MYRLRPVFYFTRRFNNDNKPFNVLVMTIHKAFPVILSAILMLGLQACEKTVDFELKDSEPKVVVDGSIETGVPPYVFLTRSIGFFSTIDFNTLSQSFLHDAE